MDLIDFAEEYRESPDFRHLQTEHIHYVPGRGSERPTAMLLGEAPGATENLERKPFVGPSGRVLAGLMGLAGLSAEDNLCNGGCGDQHAQGDCPHRPEQFANVYITNAIHFRPPGNRTPTGVEIERARPWVRKEWKILRRPPVIVTIGAVPLKCIAPTRGSITKTVAQPFQTKEDGPTIWPMYHPAYALRNPPIRPECELHWQKLGAWLKEEGLL